MKPFDAGGVPPITFGAGRLEQAGAIAARLGEGPVLVVADAVLDSLGVTARLTASLENAGLGVELAAEIAGEPNDTTVDRLAARARATGAGVVIGLGGGAAMDAAKLVAGIVSADMPAARYALGATEFPVRTVPSIAIPTTAGTGSSRTATTSPGPTTRPWASPPASGPWTPPRASSPPMTRTPGSTTRSGRVCASTERWRPGEMPAGDRFACSARTRRQARPNPNAIQTPPLRQKRANVFVRAARWRSVGTAAGSRSACNGTARFRGRSGHCRRPSRTRRPTSLTGRRP